MPMNNATADGGRALEHDEPTMNQRLTPRYGLSIDTTAVHPKLSSRARPSSARHANKTPPGSARGVQSEGVRSAIDIILELEKSRPASRAIRSSRQRRDDSSDVVGHAGGSGRIETSPNNDNGGIAASPYRPKFFNYEPSAAASPGSACYFERPFDESPVREAKEVPAARQRASPRKSLARATPDKTAAAVPNATEAAAPNSDDATASPAKSHRCPKEAKRINIEAVYAPRPLPARSQRTPPSRPPSPPRPSAPGFDAPSPPSAPPSAPAGPSDPLRSRGSLPKPRAPLSVVCDEGGFEVRVRDPRGFAERDAVHRSRGRVRRGSEGRAEAAGAEGGGGSDGAEEPGRNGWHRLLGGVVGDGGRRSSFSPEAAATLDRLRQIHVLQRSLPVCDEYEALSFERESLLAEVEALEKDRTCLERQFAELEAELEEIDSRSTRKDACSWTYRDFKENASRIDREDKKHLPMLWLEELADMQDSSRDGSLGKYKRRTRPRDEDDDAVLADRLRDERGTGFALLMCDANAKNSLIGRCYMNSIGKGRKDARVLSVEGPAILIPNGGVGVRYFGLTGSRSSEANGRAGDAAESRAKDSGACYFIKFDAGKSHHRGKLPVNLADRLRREKRDSRSLRYLSAGPSSRPSDGSSRAVSYYAEFDDGECWWGMADRGRSEEDNALHRIYLEMDVHRVAFGEDSSWIVLSKDGDVVWKNVPQGLHDVLISRDAENGDGRVPAYAAPCEVSLGMGGSWFIRFLDGTIEYSLPSFAADVCDRLEAKGEVIRNVSLNADTYDCLIRYSSKS